LSLFRDPLRVILGLAIAVLAGATAFGLWHIVVGGLVSGNERAGAFGVVLAIAAGGLLTGTIALFRRRATR
jgi:hypothetical protein